ncbi:hypothetical protein ABEB36_008311 [Hypothenemus hampei]|uniref:Uncharacterized protein n=1 Tax=Hypothenemus hampei TaxID=57062 RepID=A0ABD1ELF0_HYPHA
MLIDQEEEVLVGVKENPELLEEYPNANSNFLDRILFTDETFAHRGVYNWQKNHLWDSENSHEVHLGVRENMWFRHDEILGDFSEPGPKYLDIAFPIQQIGCGSNFAWLPRSSN